MRISLFMKMYLSRIHSLLKDHLHFMNLAQVIMYGISIEEHHKVETRLTNNTKVIKANYLYMLRGSY